MKPIVYFSREITPEKVLELYRALGKELPGKIAVKVHSGEEGNQNFLHPEFWKSVVDAVNGTVVECNTAYEGARNLTEQHRRLLRKHGWSEVFDVDILDAEGPDLELPIPNGSVLKKDIVGKDIENYDSMLRPLPLQGPPDGRLRRSARSSSPSAAPPLRARCGSTPAARRPTRTGSGTACTAQDLCSSRAWRTRQAPLCDHFRGSMAFVNVMKNLSVDCDCCAVAEDPCMKDIGILASLDPVAVDQACIDLIYAATDDPGQKHFIERVESLHGIHTIECAAALGVGSREYELVEL